MGSRMLLTLAHIASQRKCCENCSCAAASARFEGCAKFGCIWRRLASNLRSSSVVRSGSSCGFIRTSKVPDVTFKRHCQINFAAIETKRRSLANAHGLSQKSTNQKFIMNLLSIPDYVIKKGRLDGHRYGKKPGDREYYTAN